MRFLRQRLRATIACLGFVTLAAMTTHGPERSEQPIGAGSGVLLAARPFDDDSVRGALARRLDATTPPPTMTAAEWERVRRLYASSSRAPLWLGAGRAPERAIALVQSLADAHEDALRPPAAELSALLEILSPARDRTLSAERLADADIMLTRAFSSFAERLLLGQLAPGALGQAWHIETREPAVDSLLASALRQPGIHETLEFLRPTDPEYRALRGELARYRSYVNAGGWPRLAAERSHFPGDTVSADRLMAIVGRLRAEAQIALGARAPLVPSLRPGQSSTLAIYDGEIAAAVARFQARRGIVVDSILGPETREALNVPAEYRLGQIAANLERHRWLPRVAPPRYIRVNVPGFSLYGVENGREVVQMRVIVGAPRDRRDTPTFESTARAVVFRPYWNVPDRIAATELWPLQRRDPGYFERHRYEVVTQDGRRLLRQKPGPDNALGLMKLDLPNRFDIYLHDTPTAALFDRDVRAFSHGCIRVQQPAALAQWVLGWDADRVYRAMHEGANAQQVPLPRPIPVRVVYFTVFGACEDLHFGNDIYGRDAAVIRALGSAMMPDSAALVLTSEVIRRLRS